MKSQLTIFLFCLMTSLTWAQFDINNTEISVLTSDLGDELYSTFGHTALRVSNVERKVDQVYNYGVFDFKTEGFYIKFMRGLLPYRLGVTNYNRFLQEYHAQQRTVWEQKLDLTIEQKQFVLDFLRENLKPENIEYPYDFFFDNCTTRIDDIATQLGDISYIDEIEQKTFRDMLKENLRSMPWTEFGIDLVIGARADRMTTRHDQMFLPLYFHDQLNETQLDGNPILTSDYLVLDFIEEGKNRKESSFPYPILVFGLIFLIRLGMIFIKNGGKLISIFDKVFLVLISIVSILLAFMWFGTAHQATNDNWNLLWASPLFVFYRFWKDNKWVNYLVMGLLVIAGLNCLVQFLPQFYHLAFLPIIGVLGLVIIRNLKR